MESVTGDANWSRIKELFQAAIQRAPNERAAFLERACAEDRALHREVMSLLSAHHEAGTFAERPAIETLAGTTQPDVDYQIVSTLGAGGMGEVFRARDVALGREVAIKILPPGLASDPERLARFDREARVLAALNHPNICAIYGITDISGTPGLVLELVEGPTLRERLEGDARGAGKARRLGMKEAIAIGRDIARALEAAHEKGIIHRDLKPANIKITPDGVVKVLDFGLAKASADPERVGLQASAPMACESQDGARLGTAAYMSPEQARGEPVDKRTDIWAFGAVMYEMFSGRRAATGATVSETIAAVLESDPDWTAMPASVPPNIRRLVRRCLERDAKRRLKDIGDACLDLDDALTLSGEKDAIAGGQVRTSMSSRAWLWSLVAVVALGAAVFFSWPDDAAQAPAAPRRLIAELGTDASLVTFQLGQDSAVILSPDGAVLAFIAQVAQGAARQIYVRRLDELKAVPLAGTDGALNPFFSPDGRWIAFFADGKLKKVPTAGGGAITICAVQTNRGGAWGEDGLITFSPDRFAAPLWQVSSEENSVPVQLTTLGEGETTQRWPQMLRGGKTVLFTGNSRADGFQEANVVVQSLPNGPRKVLVPGAYYGRYLASGHLAYVHDGTVFAAPFDIDRLELAGPAVPVLEGATVNMPTGSAEIAFSDAGTAAYLPVGLAGQPTLDAPIDWMDRSGATRPMRTTATRWLQLRFASDGRRLAFALFDGKQEDIWTYAWSRDQATKLTFDQGFAPVWTPDASRIVFESNRGDGRIGNLHWQRVDGADEPQRLTYSDRVQTPGSWHPDGRILAFTETDAATGTPSIMMLRLDGDEVSGWRPAEPTSFMRDAGDPAFSPDGRWVAYTARSASAAATEVFVRPYAGAGGPWQISTQGGAGPVWSSTRDELFYGTPDNQIMVTSYWVTGGSFRWEKPRLVPGSAFARRIVGRSFDLHPDGDRFALVKAPAIEASRNRVILIFNFFDELRRIAPASSR
jgi:serine/threonine protein kinase/Tol biopolymer transport system component